MLIFTVVLLVLVILAVSYIFMVMPRVTDGADMDLQCADYAHRGLHGGTLPENSLPAFVAARDLGYGIELDVHITAEGTPAVIHDPSLLRTAGVDIDITAMADGDVKAYPLEGTGERIPFFTEVLESVGGAVPLLIELKVDRDNYEAVCDATVKALEGYKGIYAIQCFDPRAIKHLRIRHPHIMRGQLSGFLIKSGTQLNHFMDFGLRNLLTNFMAKPHFISYRVQDSDNIGISVCRKLYRPLEFNWTCRKKAHHVTAYKNGAIPIFEKYIPK